MDKELKKEEAKQMVGQIKAVLYQHKLQGDYEVKIATLHTNELPTITILPKK